VRIEFDGLPMVIVPVRSPDCIGEYGMTPML